MENLQPIGGLVNAPASPLYQSTLPAPASTASKKYISPVRLATRQQAKRLTELTCDAQTLVTPLPLYDIAGSHVGGTILGRILYWHQSAKNGDTRLRIEREGKMWLAKQYADFWDEARASEAEAESTLARLARLGLVEWHVWKFDGDPTVHIRLIEERFAELWAVAVAAPNQLGTYRPRKRQSTPAAPTPSGAPSLEGESRRARKANRKELATTSVSGKSPETITGVSAVVTQGTQQQRSREKSSRLETAGTVADALLENLALPAPHTYSSAPQSQAQEAQLVLEYQESTLLSQMQELQVEGRVARGLLRDYGSAAVVQQLAWLPQRAAHDPAAMLVQAVKKEWGAPAPTRSEVQETKTTAPTQAEKAQGLAVRTERERRLRQAEEVVAQRLLEALAPDARDRTAALVAAGGDIVSLVRSTDRWCFEGAVRDEIRGQKRH